MAYSAQRNIPERSNLPRLNTNLNLKSDIKVLPDPTTKNSHIEIANTQLITNVTDRSPSKYLELSPSGLQLKKDSHFNLAQSVAELSLYSSSEAPPAESTCQEHSPVNPTIVETRVPSKYPWDEEAQKKISQLVLDKRVVLTLNAKPEHIKLKLRAWEAPLSLECPTMSLHLDISIAQVVPLSKQVAIDLTIINQGLTSISIHSDPEAYSWEIDIGS